MVAWALEAADRPISGLAAAADREQAKLLRRAIARLAAANPERLGRLKVTEASVKHVVTGSELRIISSDVASSYGELVDFIICDELSHWPHAELWYSLLSTAAKREHCLLVVTTNAGVGQGWQWRAREVARTDNRWHFASLSGVQAPWITESILDEQQRMLPEPVFRRLWLNEWQQSDGTFVAQEDVAACEDTSLSIQSSGQPNVRYVAAIDYGEKHDYTAAAVAHHDGERVVIDRLDVVVPSSLSPVPVHWVSDWIERQGREFGRIEFWVDAHQLVGVIQQLEGRWPITRFNFAGGRGNHELTVALRQAIQNGWIAWPKECGAIPSHDGSPDNLTTELASLVLRQTVGGRVRFDHVSGQHDDRAFVVALVTAQLLNRPTSDWMTVSHETWID